jgi:hypothetical protein
MALTALRKSLDLLPIVEADSQIRRSGIKPLTH